MTYRDTEEALRAKIESLEAENQTLRNMSYVGGSIFDPDSAAYWKDRAQTIERMYLALKKRKEKKRPMSVAAFKDFLAIKDWFKSSR